MSSVIRKEAKRYLDHVPMVLQDLVEIRALDGAIEIEMEKLHMMMEQLEANQYVSTMDLQTTMRWESILNLTTPISDTIESRRQAIAAKLLSQPPINLETLREIVQAYLGVSVNIAIHNQPYTVNVTYRGLAKLPDLIPLYKTIYDVIPANMILEIAYAYVTWNEVKTKIWAEIGQGTWGDLLMGANTEGEESNA